MSISGNSLPPLSPATNNNNNNNHNAASGGMSSTHHTAHSTYRSKFAGMPGSASALHLHYGFKSSAPAFDPLPASHTAVVARREMQRWAQGQRLGQKHEWDVTTACADTGGHPKRALMHQLSEFQAPRLVPNFRAQQIATVHKHAVPVWKPSKFRVDQTAFLSKKERELVTRSGGASVTALSHAELPITEDPEVQKREAGWNISSSLEPVRANLFAKKEYEDLRPLNKTKAILDQDRYVSPVDDIKRKMDSAREQKRQQRHQHDQFVARMKREARARRGLRPMSLAADVGPDGQAVVFKMSNIDSWWDQEPVELKSAVETLEQRRRAEEERLAKKAAAEAEARGGGPQGIRVVAPGQQQGGAAGAGGGASSGQQATAGDAQSNPVSGRAGNAAGGGGRRNSRGM